VTLLQVEDLRVEFDTFGGVVQAVRGVSFELARGETLAIVGESGSGKSVSVQALMGLTPQPPGRITSGKVRFADEDVPLSIEPPPLAGASGSGRTASNTRLSSGQVRDFYRRVRGKQIGMVFQDPMTSLNPTMTVGRQITETLRFHDGLNNHEARNAAIQLLERVRIPDAKSRIDQYPFQFSGGMRQRVMIAMAIACRPSLLIADEPTTALDVTVQAQILDLMREIQEETQMSVILITHDLGVVARMADRVLVMYAGQLVESGTVEDIFYRPAHPYTLGLAAARPPAEEGAKARLAPIKGAPPDLFHPPPGCGYAERCPFAMRLCDRDPPPLFAAQHAHESRCWLHHPAATSQRPAALFPRGVTAGDPH
jgi:oligopeptide/dipeptide ABC transporter ATP-binding protein